MRKNYRKSFLIKKEITGALFLAAVFGFGILNLRTAWPQAEEILKSGEGYKAIIENMDAALSDNVFRKYDFIEIYGYIQTLLNKDEFNNFEMVKDTDGKFHYTYFTNGSNDMVPLADRMARLNETVKSAGDGRLIYMMTPDKYIPGFTEFPSGIPYSYVNEGADELLELLKERKIDVFDFRERLEDSGLAYQDLFYTTDHHWTTQTCFWAFTEIAGYLESLGAVWKDKDFYTDPDNYNFLTYQDVYLGSMGRKAGMLYTGTEDFTLIYPKFDTDFYYYGVKGDEETRLQGRFENALLFKETLLEQDYFKPESDKFFTYLMGNIGYVEVTNNRAPEDAPKVLFIKDSLMVPPAAFLASMCSKVYLLDPRYYNGDFNYAVESTDADYIIVSFDPQNLTEEFFAFGAE